MRLMIMLAVVFGLVAHADAAPPIVVSSASELQAAVVPANSGRTIVVRAGDYEVSQTLVVPEGAALVGEGVMMLGDDALPKGFRAGTRTTLRSAATLVGDIVSLGNGSNLSRLAIEDSPARLGGNLVVVSSRRPDDVVSATIDECELVNPNGGGIAFNGPSGRGLLVITRNPRQMTPPAPHAGAVVAAQMRGSIVRSPGNGSGIFAVNFAPNAQIDIYVERNVVGGGLDASGGVSRPVSVLGAATRISSRGNLYRSDSAENPANVGWRLNGGSGPPVAILTVGSTSDNLLSVDSTEDRIEGFNLGIYAWAGRRSFGPPIAGTSDRNRTELQLRGTRIASLLGDLWLIGAEAPSEDVSPGDGNLLYADLRGVSGSSAPENLYANVTGPDGVIAGAAGYGNRLEIKGNSASLLHRHITPPPPDEFFVGPE
jgi:hypothetical protein